VIRVRRVPKTAPHARKDAVFPHQTSEAVFPDLVTPLAQLVDDARAAIAGLVLDVNGANLGEEPLIGEGTRRRFRAPPGVVGASRYANSLEFFSTSRSCFSCVTSRHKRFSSSSAVSPPRSLRTCSAALPNFFFQA